MQSKYSLVPPSIEELLEWEQIGTHDAAFLLSEWPQHGGSAYYPDPMMPFEPSDYGCRFIKLFDDLNQAVVKGELCAGYTAATKGVPYVVRPYDAILWALLRGEILPKRLQEALGLKQMDSAGWTRAKAAITNKVVFQCILVEHQYQELKQYLGHRWIKKAGGEIYCDEGEHKALKRHLFEAIGYKAGKGGDTKSQFPLSIRPVKEVMSADTEYNMQALKMLLDLVCSIHLKTLQDDKRRRNKATQESFMVDLIDHPVVAPYFVNAPDILLRIVVEICSRYVCRDPVTYLIDN